MRRERHPAANTGSSTNTGSTMDAWTKAGVAAIFIVTAVTSFSALSDLAHRTQWRDELAPLLPLSIDLYAVVATRIWFVKHTPPRARSHARVHALAAIVLSMIGNGISHALEYGALRPGSYMWLLVVAVGLVPPGAMAAVTHLVGMLLYGHDAPAPSSSPSAPTEPSPQQPPAVRSGDTGPASAQQAAPTPPPGEPPIPQPAPSDPAEDSATTPTQEPTTADNQAAPFSPGPDAAPAPRPASSGLAHRALTAAGSTPVTVRLAVPSLSPQPHPPAASTDNQPDDLNTKQDDPAPPASPVPGGRPDPRIVENVRRLWLAERQAGRVLSDRKLAAAARAKGWPIGRRTCGRIIREETTK